MTVKIKKGEVVGDLTILNQIRKRNIPKGCRFFICVCACSNFVQRTESELEYFPAFRRCEQCAHSLLYAHDLWGQFLDMFDQHDYKERTPPEKKYGGQPLSHQPLTKLPLLFNHGEPYGFDVMSRTLTINFVEHWEYLQPFIYEQQHRWEPITQQLNISLKFVFYKPRPIDDDKKNTQKEKNTENPPA